MSKQLVSGGQRIRKAYWALVWHCLRHDPDGAASDGGGLFGSVFPASCRMFTGSLSQSVPLLLLQ